MMSALRRLRNDQLSGLVLMALGGLVGWENRSYPLGTLQEPGPGYTPFLVAIFLSVIGLLIALQGRGSPRLAETKWPEAKRAIIILAACGVATYALESVGYRITIAALLVFFLGVLERRHPAAVVAVGIGFSVISFYVIGDVLHVPLPRGPWGW
jgi:hypothetical protein